MNDHFFKVLAKDYGVNCAVVLKEIYFWLKVNLKKKRNIIKGSVWTYSSVKELEKRIVFLSDSQIRTAISRLIKLGVLVKDFLGKGYDRTSWFSIPKEVFEKLLRLEKSTRHPSDKSDNLISCLSQIHLLNSANDINNNINISFNKEYITKNIKEEEAPPSPEETEKLEAFVKSRLEKENPELLQRITRECGSILKFVTLILIPAKAKYGDSLLRKSFETFIRAKIETENEKAFITFYKALYLCCSA